MNQTIFEHQIWLFIMLVLTAVIIICKELGRDGFLSVLLIKAGKIKHFIINIFNPNT